MTCSEPYVLQKCTEVESLFKQASTWAAQDDHLGAHLAAYTTVIIVGVFEDCIEHLFGQMAHRTASPNVAGYVTKMISERFRNPDWGTISSLLKDFSPAYQQKFKDRVSHDGAEALALQSIVSNKNSLAHLGTAKIEIDLKDAEEYYRRVLPILEAVEQALI